MLKMDISFKNFEELNVSKNRCVGLTKSGKRCRTRLSENQYLFCCDDHKPYNTEILEDGCFCCTEKIVNHKDAYFFRCKHMVHKECYNDWVKSDHNRYEMPICIVCRSPIYKPKVVRQPEVEAVAAVKDIYEITSLFEKTINDHAIHSETYKKNTKRFEFHGSNSVAFV